MPSKTSNGTSNGRVRREGDAVARAVDAIGELITQRRLAPGEQVRQEELSERLGLSRGPVREALKVLSAQQLLRHEPNRGYFVAQFSASEMMQLYTLRRLAETELLKTVRRATAAEIVLLREINTEIGVTERIDAMSRLNDQFHLTILGLSPLRLIFDNNLLWWRTSASYRALSLGFGPREAVIGDHAQMIAALEDHDRERLVSIADTHRTRSETNILPLLPMD